MQPSRTSRLSSLVAVPSLAPVTVTARGGGGDGGPTYAGDRPGGASGGGGGGGALASCTLTGLSTGQTLTITVGKGGEPGGGDGKQAAGPQARAAEAEAPVKPPP
ncbi:hypothetical protein GCM10010317_008760 [Streptomyces mirabilis]|uniref:glycine-rich domain-containing protein n=1 Tax=Streptomyces mirabilis TaxID=68239 RepID=UPI00198F0E41|nr:hypothetical protein GCM10010317_008760 [Streptomyces mirabilis]